MHAWEGFSSVFTDFQMQGGKLDELDQSTSQSRS